MNASNRNAKNGALEAGKIVNNQTGDSRSGGSPEVDGVMIVVNNVRNVNSNGKVAEAGTKERNGSAGLTGTRMPPPRGGPRHKVVGPTLPVR